MIIKLINNIRASRKLQKYDSLRDYTSYDSSHKCLTLNSLNLNLGFFQFLFYISIVLNSPPS